MTNFKTYLLNKIEDLFSSWVWSYQIDLGAKYYLNYNIYLLN